MKFQKLSKAATYYIKRIEYPSPIFIFLLKFVKKNHIEFTDGSSYYSQRLFNIEYVTIGHLSYHDSVVISLINSLSCYTVYPQDKLVDVYNTVESVDALVEVIYNCQEYNIDIDTFIH